MGDFSFQIGGNIFQILYSLPALYVSKDMVDLLSRHLGFSQLHCSALKIPRNLRRHSPALPSIKVLTLRLRQIEHDLALRSVLGHAGAWSRLLGRRGRIERVAKARRGLCGSKSRLVGENALGAEESVGPVRAVDVGSVGDGGLREGAGCNGGRAVVPECTVRIYNFAGMVGPVRLGRGQGVMKRCTYAVFLKELTMLCPLGHDKINSLFNMTPPKLTPLHPVPFPPRVAMKSVLPVLFSGRAMPKK